MQYKPLSPAPRSESLVDVEVKKTTCYMCACRCGIRVHLREGEIRYIDGNPDHPLNKGVICAKGASGIMKQNSPARLTQPLLRKHGANRGDSAFEAISWDRAFSIGCLRRPIRPPCAAKGSISSTPPASATSMPAAAPRWPASATATRR